MHMLPTLLKHQMSPKPTGTKISSDDEKEADSRKLRGL